MKKDADEGVSVVVALMLILAIISICIAAYTTTYVPGLKQQDEITKSDDIRYAFERFSSDIDNIISLDRNASFTETLPLGGGDIILSAVKSSGTVEISNYTIGKLTIGANEVNISAVSIEYLPSYSSWEPQGYLYRNGVLWISKNEKMVPSAQNLYTYQNGTDAENETLNKWLSNPAFYRDGYNATLTLFSMSKADNAYIASGSGFARLRVDAETTDTLYPSLPSGTEIKIVNITNSPKYSQTLNQITNLTVRMMNIKVSVE